MGGPDAAPGSLKLKVQPLLQGMRLTFLQSEGAGDWHTAMFVCSFCGRVIARPCAYLRTLKVSTCLWRASGRTSKRDLGHRQEYPAAQISAIGEHKFTHFADCKALYCLDNHTLGVRSRLNPYLMFA